LPLSWVFVESVELPDGRTLEYLVEGPADGRTLVLHHGTPGGAVRCAPLADPALRLGYRVVFPGRPGYGGSTPQPGRRIADVAADVTALLDALGAADFVTLGWSGGGPHALACAALLPGRCRAAVTVAGVAPYPAEGLDWLAGMGAENQAEFGAAFAGREALEQFMAEAGPVMAGIQPGQVIEALGDLISDVDAKALVGDLISDVDAKALVGDLADYLAESSRYSVSTGIAGWRDDDLAFVAPWGFDLGAIRVPVAIWQGDQDRMVPFDHGRWLATHVAGATAHLVPGEGHLSLVRNAESILADLAGR
jgi:pimeloyl-ACP methyl ester carboxylesterase